MFSGVAVSARYADLAEKYEADAEYEPGTVVKIGGERNNNDNKSCRHRSVWCYSTDPYIMNNDCDGLPVALQGFRTKSNWCQKGERLTTSDAPGAWGRINGLLQAIIGRALEDKEDGDHVLLTVIGVK